MLGRDRRLDLGHPVIEADHVVEVAAAGLGLQHHLGVVADQLQLFGKGRIVCHDDCAFARVDVLVIIEAKHAHVAECPGVPFTRFGASD